MIALPLSRDEAVRRIEAAGGIVRGSVSKATHYVIIGVSPGEKLTRAKTLNIPVLDDADLLKLLANPPANDAAQ